MNTEDYLYSKQFQANVIKQAESDGIEARPVQRGEEHDVEFKCKDCQQWDLDVNRDGLCMGCYYQRKED